MTILRKKIALFLCGISNIFYWTDANIIWKLIFFEKMSIFIDERKRKRGSKSAQYRQIFFLWLEISKCKFQAGAGLVQEDFRSNIWNGYQFLVMWDQKYSIFLAMILTYLNIWCEANCGRESNRSQSVLILLVCKTFLGHYLMGHYLMLTIFGHFQIFGDLHFFEHY